MKGKLQLLLSRILQTAILVEKVSVRMPDCGKKTESGIILILQMQIKEQMADSVQTRIMELDICESAGNTYSGMKKLGGVSFCLNYYCVEAPAILIDSGVTKIRIAYDTFVERCIGEAFA